MKPSLTRQKWLRYIQTILLSLIMIGLLVVSGIELFGKQGLLLLTIFAVVIILFFYQAKPARIPPNLHVLNNNDNPILYSVLGSLSKQAHLAVKPTLLLLPELQMNAATIMNQKQPAIVLTSGLLQRLSERELRGVLAHEIGHIKQDDHTLFLFIEIVRRITSFIARFGWIMILFFFPFLYISGIRFTLASLVLLLALPFLSLLIQLALLRTREFAADLNAVELTGDPEGLASALQKIDYQQKRLLSYFIPLPDNRNSSIFKTHPATEERIKRLLELKGLKK
ncbi:MAG: M48 family metalloprotease [Spirochaetia bacterium]